MKATAASDCHFNEAAVPVNGHKSSCALRLLLILAFCGCVEVIQDALQVIKRWPLLRLFFPAHFHDVVELIGAVLHAGHPVAL